MISIVVPSCKWETLKPCLESIERYTNLNTRVIVVANGMQMSHLRLSEYEGELALTYKWFDERIGFTRAVNEGIKAAGTDDVIILNDDTVLLPQAKNAWLSTLQAPIVDKKVGITGPLRGWSNEIGKWFMIFFCVMIPRRVLDDVGLLDEVFNPGFGEDIDWCMRAEAKGYTMVQVPAGDLKQGDKCMVGGFPIWHAGHKTMGAEYDPGIAKNIALLKKMYPIEKEIDGYMLPGEMEFLKTEAMKHKRILEVGSWHGKSTRVLGKHTPGCVYAVDTWNGTPNEMQWHGSARLNEGDHAFMEFCKNNADLIDKGKIIPIRMHSANACQVFKDKGMKFDMVFIDGDHTYDGVKTDLMGTKDLLADGALWCGHDYHERADEWVGVKKAVDEVIPEVNLAWGIWHKKNKYKITDCTVFYNENDLLDVRLHELKDVVDEFVVVESRYTFSGQEKPLNFDEERFKSFPIKYIVLDEAPEGDWARENYQRMQIQEYVSPDTDIVISTDIDEIPDSGTVQTYRPPMGLRYLDMGLYYYWINCYVSQWFESKIIGYDDYMKMTPVQVRNTNCPKLEGHGGWHFSYLGGVDAIIAKIKAYAHQEFNKPEILDPAWIEYAINKPCDVLKRPWVPSATETARRDGHPCYMKFVSVDNSYPKYITDNIERFRKWIHK